MQKNKNENKIRIFITGTWLSSSNIGDNAIASGIRKTFNERYPTEITALTSNPERVKKALGINALRFKDNPFKVINAIRKSDYFLFTGGTPFYDDFVHMSYFSCLALSAFIFNVPVIVFGITLRSLTKMYSKLFLNLIASLSIYFGVREYDSQNKAKEILAKKLHSKIRIMPDLAFQLEYKSENQRCINNQKEINSKDFVVICPKTFESTKYFQKSHHNEKYSKDDIENYINSLVKITDWLIRKKNMNVVFFPMHIHEPDDDRVVGRKVLNRISDNNIKNNIFLIDDQYGPSDALCFFGKAKMVIGVRFHSVLLSIISGTPPVSFGYSTKNKSLMDLFNMQSSAYTVHEMDFNLAKKAILETLTNEKRISENMLKKVELLRDVFKNELNMILDKTKYTSYE